MNPGRAKRDEARHFGRLIIRVQVEMNTRRELQRRVMPIQCDVRPNTVSGTKKHEIVTRFLARQIVERSCPECGLTSQIVDTQHYRSNPDHGRTIAREPLPQAAAVEALAIRPQPGCRIWTPHSISNCRRSSVEVRLRPGIAWGARHAKSIHSVRDWSFRTVRLVRKIASPRCDADVPAANPQVLVRFHTSVLAARRAGLNLADQRVGVVPGRTETHALCVDCYRSDR